MTFSIVFVLSSFLNFSVEAFFNNKKIKIKALNDEPKARKKESSQVGRLNLYSNSRD
jgi:hypothetical protein